MEYAGQETFPEKNVHEESGRTFCRSGFKIVKYFHKLSRSVLN